MEGVSLGFGLTPPLGPSQIAIWSFSGREDSKVLTETHPASVADLVRQLILRAKPELAGSLENMLMDLHGGPPSGDSHEADREDSETKSSEMTRRLQALREEKESLLEDLGTLAVEADSQKAKIFNLSSWKGIQQPTPLAVLSDAIDDVVAPPFSSSLEKIDLNFESRCEIQRAGNNCFESDDVPDHLVYDIEIGSLEVARLRLQNLQNQVEHLSRLQAHLARTSEEMREALDDLNVTHDVT